MYTVTEDGKVLNKHGKEMKPYIAQNRNQGYFRVALIIDGKAKKFMVHRLVAQLHVPNPDNKPFVNHKDRNTFNNHYSNLEWVTCQENAEHALSTTVYFKNPEGEPVEIHNLTKFCREHNLIQANMYKVVKGERNHHRGWTKFEPA